MGSFREIVTKAILGKGKKTFVHQGSIDVKNNPSTVLGCWVINHNFNGVKQNDRISIAGSYDINIWYSYDNDTKTDVIKETHNYNEVVKMHNENNDYNDSTIIVRSLNDPKCIKVDINNNKIDYQVEVELGVELVGETKVKISVDDNLDDYSLIVDEENVEQEIDESVDENYLENNNDK